MTRTTLILAAWLAIGPAGADDLPYEVHDGVTNFADTFPDIPPGVTSVFCGNNGGILFFQRLRWSPPNPEEWNELVQWRDAKTGMTCVRRGREWSRQRDDDYLKSLGK